MTLLMSQFAKATRPAERTKAIGLAMACYNTGTFMGPAYNLLLCQLSFKVGSFSVSETNSPGLLLAFSWAALQILFLFTYFDAGKELQKVLLELERSFQIPLRNETGNSQNYIWPYKSQK